MCLENIWEKEIKKRKKRGAGAAGPTRLNFGPLRRVAQLLPPPRRARTCPPFSTRCRPRGGRTLATWPRPPGSDRHDLVGMPPRSPRRLHSPCRPLFCLGRSRSQAPPWRHCWPKLRRSPLAVSAGHSPRQGHRRVRHRHGKHLRTLNRGVRPPRDRNSSLEFT